MPPWFNGAMENILGEYLAPIRGDLQILKDDVRDIKRVQCHIWKLAAKVSNVFPMVPPLIILIKMIHSNLKYQNMSAGAGDDAILEVVPFSNGQDPTKEPVCFCSSSTSATS